MFDNNYPNQQKYTNHAPVANPNRGINFQTYLCYSNMLMAPKDKLSCQKLSENTYV